MIYEFFPVTWTKSNPKPPKLPKALNFLTISDWAMIIEILNRPIFQKK